MKKINIRFTLPNWYIVKLLFKKLYEKFLRKYRNMENKELYKIIETSKDTSEIKAAIDVLKERKISGLGDFVFKTIKKNPHISFTKILPVLRDLKPIGLTEFLIKKFKEEKNFLKNNDDIMIITTIGEIGEEIGKDFLKDLTKSKNPIYRFYAKVSLDKNYQPSREEIKELRKEFKKRK